MCVHRVHAHWHLVYNGAQAGRGRGNPWRSWNTPPSRFSCRIGSQGQHVKEPNHQMLPAFRAFPSSLTPEASGNRACMPRRSNKARAEGVCRRVHLLIKGLVCGLLPMAVSSHSNLESYQQLLDFCILIKHPKMHAVHLLCLDPKRHRTRNERKDARECKKALRQRKFVALNRSTGRTGW